MLTTPLETDRLIVRPFTPDDWSAVHAFTSDPATMHFMPEGVLDADQTRAFINENMGAEAQHHAVILKADNQLIGHIVFHPWFSARIYEIGWVLNPRYHRQGYTTEAAAALLRYGFETLDVHRVIATCQPENPASYRVMEKLGMKREGHLRQRIERPDGVWWDEYFYALLEDEWFAQAATLATTQAFHGKEAG